MKFKIVLVLAILFSHFVLIQECKAQRIQKASDTEPTVLIVNGTGEVETTPDIATIHVGVSSKGETANEAVMANAVLAQTLIDTLKSQGILDKDIQTTSVSISPVFEVKPDVFISNINEDSKIIGYRAENTIQAKIRNVSNIGQIIDVVAGAGDFTLGGINFGLDKNETFQEEALKKAVADAKRQANVIANAVNMPIIGIKNITVGGFFGGVVSKGFEGIQADSGVTTPIQPGELTVSATVSVKYLLGN